MLSDECDYQSAEFRSVEHEVDQAFHALIEANLQSNQEIWIRTHFLIREIREFIDSGTYADKMANTIELDAFKLSQTN